MYVAAKIGNLEIVQIKIGKAVINLDIDPNEVDPDIGGFSLHVAAKYGHLQIVQILIDAGVDNNLRDFYGRTLLHCAIMASSSTVAKFLVRARANIDAKDQWGESCSVFAQSQNNCELATFLIENGAVFKKDDISLQASLS